MTTQAHTSELLFSYGTLQLENVQEALFNRRLNGRRDSLPAFLGSGVPRAESRTLPRIISCQRATRQSSA